MLTLKIVSTGTWAATHNEVLPRPKERTGDVQCAQRTPRLQCTQGAMK